MATAGREILRNKETDLQVSRSVESRIRQPQRTVVSESTRGVHAEPEFDKGEHAIEVIVLVRIQRVVQRDPPGIGVRARGYACRIPTEGAGRPGFTFIPISGRSSGWRANHDRKPIPIRADEPLVAVIES